MSKRIMMNLETIYKMDMVNRVSLKYLENGEISVTVDLHYLSCKEARQFVKNVVAMLYMIPFKLDVIHGYNGGTAIKDMLRTKEISPRIISISSPEYNPGESILEVA